jgi:hypothetical protein
MNNQWTSTEIARLESRRFIWRDAKLLVVPSWPVWLTLSSASLAIGLCWRLGSSAHPDIYRLLDICGLILWLCGWPLARSLSAAFLRTVNHQNFQADFSQRIPYMAVALAATVFAFALAPSGLLLGYNMPTILQEISTQEVPQLNLGLGGVAITSLLLGGSCYLMASSLLLLLAHPVLRRLTTPVWLIAACYVHLSTLGNLAEHVRRLTPGGTPIHSWIPATLGVSARTAMAKLSDPGLRFEYLQSVVVSSLGVWLLGLLALVFLNIFAALRSANITRLETGGALKLSSMGALLTALTYTSAQAWVYLKDASVAAPGQWTALLNITTVSLLALYMLLSDRTGQRLRASQLIWPGAVFSVVVGMTGLQVQAGQVRQTEVVVQVMMLLTGVFTALAVIAATRKTPLLGNILVTTLLLAAILPVNGNSSVLDVAREWALSGSHIYVLCGLIALALIAVGHGLDWSAAARPARSVLRPAA